MSTVVDTSQQVVATPIEPRIRLAGVDWVTFWKLAINSRGARFAFDRGFSKSSRRDRCMSRGRD
jgi:hypothetical protein